MKGAGVTTDFRAAEECYRQAENFGGCSAGPIAGI